MILRRIKQSDLTQEPYLSWNAFIDLIAIDYDDLTSVQRVAHLVFWYDAEVHNGGHLQYFVNSAGARAQEALSALSDLKMDCQTVILRDAVALISAHPISEIDTAEDYVAEALDNRFGELDSRYYSCVKTSSDYLEEYLIAHFDQFIELV